MYFCKGWLIPKRRHTINQVVLDNAKLSNTFIMFCIIELTYVSLSFVYQKPNSLTLEHWYLYFYILIDSQLAKMKKSIPDMSLPLNL